MPRWLGRILWALRGKRRARLHLSGPGIDATIEGLLIGRWGGHYVLQVPRMLEGEGRTVALEGHAEIPAERVLFVQVLGS